MTKDELKHHGVLGMKWGVRRYQNADGTLTAKGKARFRKVKDDDRLSTKNTKQAVKMLKDQKRVFNALAARSEIKAEKAYSKADKHVQKSDAAYARNNLAKFEKHESKAWKQKVKQTELLKKSEEYLKESDKLEYKINQIKSGELKAGRDFIVQNDYNYYPMLYPTPGGLVVSGVITRDQTLIEKNKE